MGKPNKNAPKISPNSLSVWQDPDDPTIWRWSAQQGKIVKDGGESKDPAAALTLCRNALGKMLADVPASQLGVQP